MSEHSKKKSRRPVPLSDADMTTRRTVGRLVFLGLVGVRLAGSAAVVTAVHPARAMSDADPVDPSGARGRGSWRHNDADPVDNYYGGSGSGFTDNDPGDPYGGGRASGYSDSDPHDPARYGQGRSDADPSDPSGRGPGAS